MKLIKKKGHGDRTYPKMSLKLMMYLYYLIKCLYGTYTNH